MNRADEIRAAARGAVLAMRSTSVDVDHATNDLVKLMSLIVAAVGKSVAVDGESDIGKGDHTCEDPDACPGDCDQTVHDAKAHNRYLIGERIQDGARWVLDPSHVSDPYAKFPRFSDPAVFAAPLNDSCPWIPGDAIPVCDFDPACPVHGGRSGCGTCGHSPGINSVARGMPGLVGDPYSDGIPDHQYSESCPGTCCGGSEPTR